jgi:hypothetical protein
MPTMNAADEAVQAQLDQLADDAPLRPGPDPLGAPMVGGPLPAAMREALLWCSYHGVIEADFINQKFTIKPSAPPAVPTVGDLKEKFGHRAPTAPGGYDKDTLFAASPRPYDPKEDAPAGDPAGFPGTDFPNP